MIPEMTNKECALKLNEIIRHYLTTISPRGSGKTQNTIEQLKYLEALTRAALLLEKTED